MSSADSPPAAMDGKTDAPTPAPTLSTEPASDTAKFSSGAHLLGFPAADECAAPTEQQEEDPGAWLVEFRAKHAGRAVYQGVFTSCPAGRDWVLRNARQATLQLDTADRRSSRQCQRRLCAVKAALLTRGTAPTTLVMTLSSRSSSVLAEIVGEQLQGAAAGVSELRLECLSESKSERGNERGSNDIAACLRSVAPALHRLSKLQLHSQYRLADIKVLCRPLSACVPRLMSLELTAYGLELPWADVFTQPTTLTHFSTSATLDDPLVSLLAKYAPAVTHLTVGDVQLSRDHSKERWAVEHLTVAKSSGGLCLASVARLPVSAGPVHIRADNIKVEVYNQVGYHNCVLAIQAYPYLSIQLAVQQSDAPLW